MLTGNCLCGNVHYHVDIDNTIDKLIFCHCQRCRKWNGSTFNAAIAVTAKELTIIKGQQSIKTFSFNGVNRSFCSECGSNLFTSRDNIPDMYRLRVGTLDSIIYPKQKIHIYTDSKANWDTICDGGSEFPEGMK